jgi:hypothetical protein
MRAGREVVSWPLASEEIDLADVDVLARLQLAARRVGCSIQLRDPDQRLVELLRLAGLTAVVPAVAGISVVEVRGQPEGREEVCVEEEMKLGDAIS